MAESNGPETILVEVRVGGDTDLTEVERELSDQLRAVDGLRIESTNVVKPFGMTGAEAAISFVISLVASVIANTYREEIDSAVKRASDGVKVAMRTVYRKVSGGKTPTTGPTDQPQLPQPDQPQPPQSSS